MKLDFSDKKQFLAKIRKIASQRKISPQILLQESCSYPSIWYINF